MLELINACYGYTPDEAAIENINIRFEQGLTMLCGPNGSGKSTLLKLLGGELIPQKGKTLIDGEEPGRMPPRKRALKLALVSQLRRAEYDFTVYDAVMMGRYSRMSFWGNPGAKDSQAVDMALERVGAAQFKKRSLRELSGGDLQRVFLARSLAQESAYLLLDEPITGLDIRFQHEFLALIRELCNAGMCAVCVLHDLSLAAQYSEKMALMSKGRLYALGSPEKILTPQAIADVFNFNGGLFEHNGKYYIETFS